MNKKQYLLMLVLAFVGSLIGGALSSRFFIGTTVAAQDHVKEVRAEKFTLVDKEGNVKGVFVTEENEPYLGLYHDKDSQILLGVINGRNRLSFWDKKGELAFFGVGNARTVLGMYDPQGKNRISLTTWAKGAKIDMDTPNHQKLHLGVEDKRGTWFWCENNRVVHGLNLEGDGIKEVYKDRNGKDKISLRVRGGHAMFLLGEEDFGVSVAGEKDKYYMSIKKAGEKIWSAP